MGFIAITNWGRFISKIIIISNLNCCYKSAQLLKICEQQLLLIYQVIKELIMLLQQQMTMKMTNFHHEGFLIIGASMTYDINSEPHSEQVC